MTNNNRFFRVERTLPYYPPKVVQVSSSTVNCEKGWETTLSYTLIQYMSLRQGPVSYSARVDCYVKDLFHLRGGATSSRRRKMTSWDEFLSIILACNKYFRIFTCKLFNLNRERAKCERFFRGFIRPLHGSPLWKISIDIYLSISVTSQDKIDSPQMSTFVLWWINI